ncbi:MAG: TldD/PmbA family protein [Candidatus Zipacnadales bacterium]
MEDLTRLAVETAKQAGAGYADARYVRTVEESLSTRNGSVEVLVSTESRGIGVRVLAERAWGFAATSELSREAVVATACLAVRVAKASALTKKSDVILADCDPVVDDVTSAYEQDPFEVPLEERIALLLDCDRLMASAANLAVREGHLRFVREEQYFASSEGALIRQEFTETGAGIECTAIAQGETQRRSYPSSHGGQMMTRGWELVEELDLPGHCEEIAQETEALLNAPHCPSGEADLILEGGQLALQLHESCGHPIELDRVLGTEASYAGTSFLTPDKLVSGFRYGSEQVNVTADATLPGGLGSFAYDDEGVPGQRIDIVKEGIFCGYLTSRETAPKIGLDRSNGTMRADGWKSIPLIRMTNINLEPGSWTLHEMIQDMGEGYLLRTNSSWSIDDKRLNFQFGTEVAYRIEGGSITGLVRNPTYTGITPQFWAACDAVADRERWLIWGVPNCGKGEPGQSAHVGHGVSAARFRNVRIGVLESDEGNATL